MTNDIPPLYDKKVICHVCDHTFTSKKLRSRFIRVKEVFNDFSKQYKDESLNPLLYEVNVCPQCGYAFNEQFDDIQKENHRQNFKSRVSANWRKQSFSEQRSYEDAVRVYKLALISAGETTQPSIVIGSLCMKLSWLSRYSLEKEEEKRFVRYAIKHFENAFTSGDFASKKMSELKVIYLLAELNRQVDNREEAVKYFSKVIQHKERHTEPQIVEMARDQWYKTREVMGSK
ncbi:DUF2225 domain-containing protein [Salipaludibacillus sp. HK11]|uniref:DUF2225 domain-containing protein n=1 Tax=Salipaludibacillus sp. HK11 TaxID=3394320 RepID=UPI0039FD0514